MNNEYSKCSNNTDGVGGVCNYTTTLQNIYAM